MICVLSGKAITFEGIFVIMLINTLAERQDGKNRYYIDEPGIARIGV